jgi:hypothetical protein
MAAMKAKLDVGALMWRTGKRRAGGSCRIKGGKIYED